MSDINVHRPTASQRTAARVVGMTYLLTIPLAAIPEFYIPSRLYGPSSMETNRLIAANVALFRLGTASNLLVFTMAAAQICGLHLVLKPVRRGITLGATVLRIIETTLLLGIVVNDVGLARYLSDPAVFNAGAATRLSIAYHSDIYAVALFLS